MSSLTMGSIVVLSKTVPFVFLSSKVLSPRGCVPTRGDFFTQILSVQTTVNWSHDIPFGVHKSSMVDQYLLKV